MNQPSTRVATIERSTRLGRIRGIDRLGAETYRGVRYAEPAQRFRAAVVATTPWQGVYDATTFKAVAPQPPIPTAVYGPRARCGVCGRLPAAQHPRAQGARVGDRGP